MQEASFSFIGYRLDQVRINARNHSSSNLSIAFQTAGLFDLASSDFELLLKVSVFEDGKASTPYVEVECIGDFHFEPATTFEAIPDYFYANSIAILFPYIRAYVSTVTVQANLPAVILPTLNLSSLGESLRENSAMK